MSSPAPSTRRCKMATIGYYHSIESFGLVDGPGVRSILFLSGCPFRCLYCHNPDTWNLEKNHPVTPEEAYKMLSRYAPYWGKDGGITISGGEPLFQLDFLIEFARVVKSHGITVTIDTSGATFSMDPEYLKKFDELLKVSDLFLLDIKTVDSELHKKITGKDNANVLALFAYLDKKNFPIWVRHVLVPGLTDDDALLDRTNAFLKQFHNIERVEVLPYHTLGIIKYQNLGIPYRLDGVEPPSEERVKNAETRLHISDYPGYKK